MPLPLRLPEKPIGAETSVHSKLRGWFSGSVPPPVTLMDWPARGEAGEVLVMEAVGGRLAATTVKVRTTAALSSTPSLDLRVTE